MTTAAGPAVLDRLVLSWRTGGDHVQFVPRFDPLSGGTHSTVLALMQSPGPATVAQGDEAVCSEDNPGPTAAAYRRDRQESGLRREQVLRWNLVPWALAGTPSQHDIEEGRLALGELLPHLTLAEEPVLVPVLAAPHPVPPTAGTGPSSTSRRCRRSSSRPRSISTSQNDGDTARRSGRSGRAQNQ